MSRRRDGAPRDAGAVDSTTARLVGPVRTCVGCRKRDAKPALLRVVVVAGVLTVDHARRLPGRGACVHPDLSCVDLADKRRAFVRALRTAGPLDVTPVRTYVLQQNPPTDGKQVETP